MKKMKLLLHNFKERRGWCKSKEKTPDRTHWRTRFGRGLWTTRKTEYVMMMMMMMMMVVVVVVMMILSYNYDDESELKRNSSDSL